MKMFEVTAIAIPRNIGGNAFDHFWSAQLHWDGKKSTTRVITEDQLRAMQQDEKDGHAIKVISFTEVKEKPVAAPIPLKATTLAPKTTTTEMPVLTTTLSPVSTTTRQSVPVDITKVSNLGALVAGAEGHVKPPWEK